MDMNITKRVCSIILAFIMVVSLTACGGKDVKSEDPNIGMWEAVSVNMFDEDYDVEELYQKGASVELKANGKFTLLLDGIKREGKWNYKDELLMFSLGDSNFSGYVENGQMYLTDMLDIELDMVLVKEGGYAGTSNPKTTGDAGYYILEKGMEDGEEISGDEFREMGFDYYVLLNQDGTVVCQTDDTATGTWKKGVMSLQNDEGDTEDIEYKIKGDKLTIDWGGLIMIYARSSNTPPIETATAEGPSKLQQWWDGNWYGYWETHSETDAYKAFEGNRRECFGLIEMNDDDTGDIYIWDDVADIAMANVTVNEDSGSDNIGAAISNSGKLWFDAPIEHADWIIDPSIYGYENYIVIDGRYDDELGGGFNYVAYLKPWGELWDDFPAEEKPLWYDTWYLSAYDKATMWEAIEDRDSHIHSGISNIPTIIAGADDSSSTVSNVEGERIDAGNVTAICPGGWKNYPVKDFFADDKNTLDPDKLRFHKGAKSEEDQDSKPGLEISYTAFDATSEDHSNDYEGKSENWGPIELGGRMWKGFVGLDVNKAFIWTNNYDGGPSVHVWIENLGTGGEKISLNDADVQAILASIEYK